MACPPDLIQNLALKVSRFFVTCAKNAINTYLPTENGLRPTVDSLRHPGRPLGPRTFCWSSQVACQLDITTCSFLHLTNIKFYSTNGANEGHQKVVKNNPYEIYYKTKKYLSNQGQATGCSLIFWLLDQFLDRFYQP